MSDLSVQFPAIRKMIIARHSEYLARFGSSISIVEGEDQLRRTRIRAKLDLMCKAFLEAKVIDSVSYGVISSRDDTYPMSVALTNKDHPIQLYLLNTGCDIIVSDSVGLAQTSDTMESRILLVTDTKRVCRRFYGVLEENFDWISMANFILDAIHETLYGRHEAIRRQVQGILG